MNKKKATPPQQEAMRLLFVDIIKRYDLSLMLTANLSGKSEAAISSYLGCRRNVSYKTVAALIDGLAEHSGYLIGNSVKFRRELESILNNKEEK